MQLSKFIVFKQLRLCQSLSVAVLFFFFVLVELVALLFLFLSLKELLVLSSCVLIGRSEHVLGSISGCFDVSRNINCTPSSADIELLSSVGSSPSLKLDCSNFEVGVFKLVVHQISKVLSILWVQFLRTHWENVIIKRSFLLQSFHCSCCDAYSNSSVQNLWVVSFVLNIWLLVLNWHFVRKRNLMSFVMSSPLIQSSLRSWWKMRIIWFKGLLSSVHSNHHVLNFHLR